MSQKQSLSVSGATDELLTRLSSLRPDSQRRWGTLNASEMLCHIGDAFDTMLGRRSAARMDNWLMRTVVRRVALHTSVTWPKGAKTMPEVDPREKGSRPKDFERERARVRQLLREFSSTDAAYAPRHPIFGPLDHEEWLTWGYRHVDHHLRQFGV